MNAPIKSLVALAFSAAWALAPYSTAEAAGDPQVEGAGLRGPLVNAGFSTTDPSCCVETDVFVSANSGTEQDHPGTAVYGVASVSIYRYDTCTDATLLQAVGVNDVLRSDEFQSQWAEIGFVIDGFEVIGCA